MERAEAHFVECSPSGYSITKIVYVPPVPHTVSRDEAFVSTNNGYVQWYDKDWVLLQETGVTGGNATVVDMDSEGNTIVGGETDDGAPFVYDINLDVTANFYVPDAGWPEGSLIRALRLTEDGDYLYVVADQGTWGTFAKFNTATGAEVWSSYVNGFGYAFGMDVDSSDNVYFPYYFSVGGPYNLVYGILKFDSDGTFIKYYDKYYTYDVFVDEGLDRIYAAGQRVGDAPDTQLACWVLSGDGSARQASFSIGDSKVMYCVITDGTNVYASGFRAAAGVGGANATVWKFDLDLALLASYDTGGIGSYLAWDENDNLVCKDKTMGKYFILDPSDLSLIESHAYTDRGDLGCEIHIIDYIDEGADGYYEIYTEDGLVDLSHLIGETVCILADGVVYPSRVVDDNGRIDCSDFIDATEVHIGLNYESKLKPMKPLPQPAMMSKKATCKQMGISVHNTDEITYGVNDDDMKQINFDDVQWKNKCEIDGLFTGSVNVSVPDGFSVNVPLQIITDAPLPCVVRAMIPKVDRGV